jgi:hypothetical protein
MTLTSTSRPDENRGQTELARVSILATVNICMEVYCVVVSPSIDNAAPISAWGRHAGGTPKPRRVAQPNLSSCRQR